MSDILAGLNPAQHEAASFVDGAILVLAGAGSGKTRVLTRRISYLIESGVSPRNILAVTFTNKAAAEMKERVEHLVGDEARDVWISTFHSACLRMLRRDIGLLGYSSGFQVYDGDNQKNVIKKIIQERGLSVKEYKPSDYVSKISEAKNHPKSTEEIAEYLKEEYDPLTVDVFLEYEKRLKQSNAVDFNDLLLLCIRLFEENPGLLWRRQNQFRYILVDEYQDTNKAQYKLIQLLGARNQNVMVVGDDDQSIYRFRGAEVQNIFYFQEDFDPVHIVRLEQNYRSMGNILEAANGLISNNTGRMEKKMWTQATQGPKLSYLQAENSWSEAERIGFEIQRLLRTGYKHSDIAIIYRTNASSLAFEQTFMQNSIPHSLVGARKFYERKEIRDVLSYLRVINNPRDVESFSRMIQSPKRGIGAKTLLNLQEMARSANKPIFDVCLEWALSKKTKQAQAMRTILERLQELRKEGESGMEAADFLDTLLQKSGYGLMLELEKEKEAKTLGASSDAQRRIDNVSALVDDITRFYAEQSRENQSSLLWLRDFLDRASLSSPTEDIPGEEQSKVTLLTGHLAKGLEFPVVFVVGMNEGTFPHFRSVDTEEDVQEERRLVYVALTRAQKKLYITRPRKQQKRDGKTVRWIPAKVSRFVSEIPNHVFESSISSTAPASRRKFVARKKSQTQERSILPKDNPTGSYYTRKPESVSEFEKGVWVSHAKFGRGKIVRRSGSDRDPKLQVFFDSFGMRSLVARFAPLEIIVYE